MERTRKFNSKMIRKRIILGKKLTRGMFDYIRRNPDEFKDLVFVRRRFKNTQRYSMKHFLKVKDIKEIILKEYGKSISSSKAYEIIRILNLELEEKNILTIRGAVSEKYFNARKKIIAQLLKGVKKNE